MIAVMFFRKRLRVEDQPSQHILLGFHQMTNIHVKGLPSRNVSVWCWPNSRNQQCRGNVQKTFRQQNCYDGYKLLLRRNSWSLRLSTYKLWQHAEFLFVYQLSLSCTGILVWLLINRYCVEAVLPDCDSLDLMCYNCYYKQTTAFCSCLTCLSFQHNTGQARCLNVVCTNLWLLLMYSTTTNNNLHISTSL